VYRRYGPPDVLSVEDVEKPVPKGDEVLVRVHAASINAADRVLLRGKPVMVNAYRPISDYARALESNGTYVMSGGGGRQILQAIFQGLWLSKTGNKTLRNVMATAQKADLLVVRDLLETGKIEPVIERTCSLGEVPDALRRLEHDHARGKTVITIGPCQAVRG
jgi:NADPH:quinone reductase-like Zn-dependent oxidoreductase